MLNESGDVPIIYMTGEMYAQMPKQARQDWFSESCEYLQQKNGIIYLPVPWRDNGRNLIGYKMYPLAQRAPTDDQERTT